MKKDINSKEDIVLLVNSFYEKVKRDDLLSGIFQHIDWTAHLEIMYRFWGGIIFDNNDYRGTPFDKHSAFMDRIGKAHFQRWLFLFHETLDENFSGEKTKLAKLRSGSIAAIFEYKIEFLKMNKDTPSSENLNS